MDTWLDAALLVKPRNLEGRFVARAANLPFLLRTGLQVSLVPPQLDAPRQVTILDISPLGDAAKGEYTVQFAEIADRSTAERLCGCHCLVNKRDVPDELVRECELSAQAELGQLTDFEVIDTSAGYIGILARIEERPMQAHLVIQRCDNSEVMVPLVDEFIDSIDEDNHRIYVTLPSGLLDL